MGFPKAADPNITYFEVLLEICSSWLFIFWLGYVNESFVVVHPVCAYTNVDTLVEYSLTLFRSTWSIAERSIDPRFLPC